MMKMRWMEYLKYFDFQLKCHPGKANKVADAFIQKELHTVKVMILEHDMLEKFQNLNLQFAWTQDGVIIGNLSITSDLRKIIRCI